MLYGRNRTCDPGRNAWRESPKNRTDALKTAILTKISKIFIKAMLTHLKNFLLGPAYFMVCSLLCDAHLQKVKFWKSPSQDFWNFSYYHLNDLRVIFLVKFSNAVKFFGQVSGAPERIWTCCGQTKFILNLMWTKFKNKKFSWDYIQK